MIIFGFRSRVKVLATMLLTCRLCSTPAAHHVALVRRWFTLFFVPVIPFSTKRFAQCVMCGGSTPLSKEEAEQLVTPAPTAPPTAAPVAVAPAVARAPETVACRACGVENDITATRCESCGKRPQPLGARA